MGCFGLHDRSVDQPRGVFAQSRGFLAQARNVFARRTETFRPGDPGIRTCGVRVCSAAAFHDDESSIPTTKAKSGRRFAFVAREIIFRE